jgi:hypothetical protein
MTCHESGENVFRGGGGQISFSDRNIDPLGHTGLNSQDGTAGTGQPGKKDFRINSTTREKNSLGRTVSADQGRTTSTGQSGHQIEIGILLKCFLPVANFC